MNKIQFHKSVTINCDVEDIKVVLDSVKFHIEFLQHPSNNPLLYNRLINEKLTLEQIIKDKENKL